MVDVITLGLLAAVLLFFFFMYLMLRRTFLGFKEGFQQSKRSSGGENGLWPSLTVAVWTRVSANMQTLSSTTPST
ncbi:hypothetical protein ACFQL1_10470 [Halomicroarcula sp. GCM10025709]|uniref:DUF7859 family protein n=1 Tax=Halomicroarcula sp. GCM10025709 TaxID=3252669 RepID=UPI00361732F2